MTATVSQEISRLFTDMSLTAALLAAVGLMLVAVEFFQPTRSVVACAGIVCMLAGITARMLASGTEGTLFFLVFALAVGVYAAHVAMLSICKRDWLKQSVYLKGSRAQAEPLVGRIGSAVADFDGYGRVQTDGMELFVQSAAAVKRGDAVRIEKVSGDRIYVVPYNPEDE